MAKADSSNGAEINPLGSADKYEAHFDRQGTHRRVLGFITTEDHAGLGPRNTPDNLTAMLVDDPNSNFTGTDDVQTYLDDLVQDGLVTDNGDGTYAVSADGEYELSH